MIHERHAQILELLQKHQTMSCAQLAKAVYASLPTIRRDLSALESRGLIRRTRGGAALMELSQQLEIPVSLRQREQTRQKIQIAHEALKRIPRGATLFLDPSTTVYQLARILPADQELTAITNSLRTAALLCQRHVRTYMIGGALNGSLSALGAYAHDMVRNLRADIMFFSASALTHDGEIMDFSESEAHLRQQMFARADKKYFLCDSSKIGKTSLHHLCYISEVDEILAETEIPQTLLTQTDIPAKIE